jgi:acyl-CoA synthetase (AMP-forming)/AMP-acid ligase II
MTESEPWSYHPDRSPVYALADIIRKRAAATPAAIALEAGRPTSFAELDRRSSQVAQALQAKDVRPGDRVAYIGASGPEFAEVMYGAAKCRAIFTAVNNWLSAREVLAILADSEPRVVITDPAAAPLVADAGTLGFDCDTLVTDLDYRAWRDHARASDPGDQAGPGETALLLYTSGTTGAPKGVELTGRNLGCALHELHTDIGLDTSSVCAAPIPFFHIAGLGMLLAANLNGGNLLLEQAPDMAGVLRMLAERKVTHAVLVPTVLQRLLALPEARSTDWSALSYVVYGASPIPLPVLQAATEVIGCKFLQSYGLTESTGGFTLLGPADHVPAAEFEHRLRSAGRPMAGSPVRVVDPVTLQDCPPGQRGEVIMSGSRVMKGYWRKPEQTAEVMLPGGWLRTGDGGSFDTDGYLYLHDRLKDMIVTGGENVYPAEVESIMTGHPDVAEVAVVGVPSAAWGESPWAVVVLRPGAQVTEAELIAWTRDRLAHFKCPSGVTLAPSLARTASGKLQKQAIRASLSLPARRAGQNNQAKGVRRA